jgi:hypothetical protein
MGHGSIEMTMRSALLAPQHNRAAGDRLVSAKTGNRGPKRGFVAASGEDELVTKLVTSENVSLEKKTKDRFNQLKNITAVRFNLVL